MLFTYKELIDLAIGSPESGHVNFYALQVLLTCFAQRLEVLDKVVEVQNFLGMDSEIRLLAGADAEAPAPVEPSNEAAAEPAIEAPIEEAPAEEVPAEEALAKVSPAEETPAEEAPAEEAPAEEAPAEEALAKVSPAEEAPVEQAPVEESAPPNEGEAKTAEENISDKTDVDAKQPESEDTPPLPTLAPDSAKIQESEPAPDVTNDASQVTVRSHKDEGVSLSNRSSQRKIGSFVDAYIVRLENRVDLIEMHREKASMDMERFQSHLKAQMMLTMELVNNVAHLLINQRQDPQRIKLVRLFAKQLRVLMETEDSKEVPLSWSSDKLKDDADGFQEEGLMEDDFLEEDFLGLSDLSAALPENAPVGGVLGTERVHNDVVYLKSQICTLTNKVNDLAAALLKHDCVILLGKFEELKAVMQELYVFQTSTRETTSHIMDTLNGVVKQIDSLKNAAVLLDDQKCDRMDMELMMAEKVNFEQLATKVSLEQLEDHKFVLDEMFCEVRSIVSDNERNVLHMIDNLRMTLGIDAMEVSLKEFREMIEKRVDMIADALQRYMDMTNDECAAAAGRSKVMQDLACLSCDTPCLMRRMERQKLPSMPKAKGSVGLAPTVAYDLGQIRGTGVMGYYPKDEFPCSTHAWTKGTSGFTLPKCNTRHAGGDHTIFTAEEHVQKVVLSKRNLRWN